MANLPLSADSVRLIVTTPGYQAAALRSLSDRSGKPVSALIRQAVDELLQRELEAA